MGVVAQTVAPGATGSVADHASTGSPTGPLPPEVGADNGQESPDNTGPVNERAGVTGA